MNEKYFVLDIETTGLSGWYGSRITAIGVRTPAGQEHIFMEREEKQTLNLFLDWFNEHSKKFDFMLTKNGKAFDIPFIATRASLLMRPASFDHRILTAFPHTDLHLITKKWISLDDFARILCLPVKTSNGFEAIRMWKEGRFEELKAYLRRDLWLTEQVYLRRKHLEGLNQKEADAQ